MVVRVRLTGLYCVYCGELADEYDHFPPKISVDWGWLLPCCHECNEIVHTKYSFDFEERVFYIKKILNRQEIRILNTPDWLPNYEKALGYSLRMEIIKWKRRKRKAKRRLAWNVENYIKSIDHNNVFAPISANSGFITWSEKEFWEIIKRCNVRKLKRRKTKNVTLISA